MKILITKVHEGERMITVVPRWGTHMAPIQLRGHDEPTVVAELLVVLDELARREGSPVLAAP